MQERTKCLIIGSGPAGYTAAIYTSRANLNPVLYEGIEPGGQLTTTTEIDNYPGYPEGIDGNQLMGHMRKQAERFGADIRRGTVTRADLSSRPFHLVVDGEKQIEADSLIIATGASARYLGLPSETKYRGQGVSACATCDGFFYRKKDVAVVGGGNVAMDAARCSKRLGADVYVVYRRGMEELPARHEEVEHAIEEGVIFKTLNNPVQINGDEQDCVKSMTCVEMELGEPDASGRRRPVEKKGSEFELDVDAVIMSLGTTPNPLIKSTTKGLEVNKKGGIIVNEDGLTSRQGVYAGGDAVTGAATVILAMGAGKLGAKSIDEYLSNK